MTTFTFSLIAPESKVMEGPAGLATMPGVTGEFGVGAAHEALIAVLDPGVVRVYETFAADTDAGAWFITGGYADIGPAHCTVLADAVEPMADLDLADLRQKLKNLTEDLDLYEEEADKRRVRRDIALMRARIRAVEFYRASHAA
ncbi:MAG TPA: ATP synthase F1 subunit epsilon [Rhodospirillaceae bacterium]|jgi:F-type H+-transporting ATPase subunit epsilon|nr:ATP synthase F1 subunit epsilon [Alphaproteobacteria bacterium]HBH26139.1 ATP synthase F1 subunit epsilon [Rhodospirillaceae bacterium]